MVLRINDTAPDFTIDTTEGKINFHEWIGDGYAVLFSHPKDFTPVCTTELGVMAGMEGEFAKRNAKIIGISVDPVEDHHRWKSDIETVSGNKVSYPMIGDRELKVAKLYDMLPASEGASSEGRTPADNATVRSVFIIGPDKKIKLSLDVSHDNGKEILMKFCVPWIPFSSRSIIRLQLLPTGNRVKMSLLPQPYPMKMQRNGLETLNRFCLTCVKPSNLHRSILNKSGDSVQNPQNS